MRFLEVHLKSFPYSNLLCNRTEKKNETHIIYFFIFVMFNSVRMNMKVMSTTTRDWKTRSPFFSYHAHSTDSSLSTPFNSMKQNDCVQKKRRQNEFFFFLPLSAIHWEQILSLHRIWWRTRDENTKTFTAWKAPSTPSPKWLNISTNKNEFMNPLKKCSNFKRNWAEDITYMRLIVNLLKKENLMLLRGNLSTLCFQLWMKMQQVSVLNTEWEWEDTHYIILMGFVIIFSIKVQKHQEHFITFFSMTFWD